MVAVLVVLTIAALIALDYFVFQKRRGERDAVVPTMPGLEPLSQAVSRLPWGVFLQPSFTWTRIEPDGAVLVGVHPMLLGVVGAPYEIGLLDNGEDVGKGQPLLRIRRDGRSLTVRSPITGRITGVNRTVENETDFDAAAKNGASWFYRIAPVDIGDEVPKWLIGAHAAEWTSAQYDRIREHLLRGFRDEDVGLALADGGEVPVGILAHVDAAAWAEFENAFLAD
jgi:glycine cleavage system H lipoate-binding protein